MRRNDSLYIGTSTSDARSGALLYRCDRALACCIPCQAPGYSASCLSFSLAPSPVDLPDLGRRVSQFLKLQGRMERATGPAAV